MSALSVLALGTSEAVPFQGTNCGVTGEPSGLHSFPGVHEHSPLLQERKLLGEMVGLASVEIGMKPMPPGAGCRCKGVSVEQRFLAFLCNQSKVLEVNVGSIQPA